MADNQVLKPGEVKPSVKSMEAWITVAAMVGAFLVALIPVVAKYVPANSAWIPILGALAAMAGAAIRFNDGRKTVKADASKALALVETAKLGVKNP